MRPVESVHSTSALGSGREFAPVGFGTSLSVAIACGAMSVGPTLVVASMPRANRGFDTAQASRDFQAAASIQREKLVNDRKSAYICTLEKDASHFEGHVAEPLSETTYSC